MTVQDDTIARLIALALGSDREEEARTSALMALKIASKHGATIRVNGRSAEVTGDAPANATDPSVSAAPQSPATPPTANQAPPASGGRKWRRSGGTSRVASWSRPFAARRADSCACCSGEIGVGDVIQWSSAIGAKCPACIIRPNVADNAAE